MADDDITYVAIVQREQESNAQLLAQVERALIKALNNEEYTDEFA